MKIKLLNKKQYIKKYKSSLQYADKFVKLYNCSAFTYTLCEDFFVESKKFGRYGKYIRNGRFCLLEYEETHKNIIEYFFCIVYDRTTLTFDADDA